MKDAGSEWAGEKGRFWAEHADWFSALLADFIPTVVDEMIQAGEATVQVATTPETWFGVTYQEDKPILMRGIRDRIAEGVYPARLWD